MRIFFLNGYTIKGARYVLFPFFFTIRVSRVSDTSLSNEIVDLSLLTYETSNKE